MRGALSVFGRGIIRKAIYMYSMVMWVVENDRMSYQSFIVVNLVIFLNNFASKQ